MAESHREHLSTRAMITFNEDNYQLQYYFTFPYPVTRHIFKNADPETQLKLRQTCKFFHKMNPMLIVETLHFGSAPSPYGNAGKYDLYVRNYEEMPIIDVVTNRIFYDSYDNRMISKIHCCEAKTICIPECELSMKEFLFFTKSGMVQAWHSSRATIHDNDGKIISLEDLLLHLPYAKVVCAQLHSISHVNSPKIASWNNKIKWLSLGFHGPIKADGFFKLLKKVLAPNARLFIRFTGLADETYVATFKAEMKAKMKTWKPQNENPRLFIHLL